MNKCQSNCQIFIKENMQKYSRYINPSEANDYYKGTARSKNEKAKSKGSIARGSKSPDNIDKISLIANREKYKHLREQRKAPSNDYNANREYKANLLQTT